MIGGGKNLLSLCTALVITVATPCWANFIDDINRIQREMEAAGQGSKIVPSPAIGTHQSKKLTLRADCIAQDGDNVFAMYFNPPSGISISEGDILNLSAPRCLYAIKRGAKSLLSAVATVRGSNQLMSSNMPYKFLISGVLAGPIIVAPPLGRACPELQAEIDNKIRHNGVSKFMLSVIDVKAPYVGSIVGSCEGGTKKIVYKRLTA